MSDETRKFVKVALTPDQIARLAAREEIVMIPPPEKGRSIRVLSFDRVTSLLEYEIVADLASGDTP